MKDEETGAEKSSCLKPKQVNERPGLEPKHAAMDYSLPGSSVHGILQTRVLEWGAIAPLWLSW